MNSGQSIQPCPPQPHPCITHSPLQLICGCVEKAAFGAVIHVFIMPQPCTVMPCLLQLVPGLRGRVTPLRERIMHAYYTHKHNPRGSVSPCSRSPAPRQPGISIHASYIYISPCICEQVYIPVCGQGHRGQEMAYLSGLFSLRAGHWTHTAASLLNICLYCWLRIAPFKGSSVYISIFHPLHCIAPYCHI